MALIQFINQKIKKIWHSITNKKCIGKKQPIDRIFLRGVWGKEDQSFYAKKQNVKETRLLLLSAWCVGVGTPIQVEERERKKERKRERERDSLWIGNIINHRLWQPDLSSVWQAKLAVFVFGWKKDENIKEKNRQKNATFSAERIVFLYRFWLQFYVKMCFYLFSCIYNNSAMLSSKEIYYWFKIYKIWMFWDADWEMNEKSKERKIRHSLEQKRNEKLTERKLENKASCYAGLSDEKGEKQFLLRKIAC